MVFRIYEFNENLTENSISFTSMLNSVCPLILLLFIYKINSVDGMRQTPKHTKYIRFLYGKWAFFSIYPHLTYVLEGSGLISILYIPCYSQWLRFFTVININIVGRKRHQGCNLHYLSQYNFQSIKKYVFVLSINHLVIAVDTRHIHSSLVVFECFLFICVLKYCFESSS